MKHREFFTRSTWTVFDKVALLIGAALLLMSLFDAKLGKFEGMVFPVVSDFHLNNIEGSVVSSEVSGQFNLVRPNCSFIQLSWVLVGESRSVPLDITFLNGPRLRHEGLNSFGPWRVNIPVDKIRHTQAVAVHQCPWRPWQTVTHLYP